MRDFDGRQTIATPYLNMRKNGSSFSLPSATETLVTGWTIDDEVNVGTVAGASVVITIPGTYAVLFQATIGTGTSSRRIADIRKGSVTGTPYARDEVTIGSTITLLATHPGLVCAAGDVVCGSVYQNSGASLNMPGTDYLQRFAVRWIGP